MMSRNSRVSFVAIAVVTVLLAVPAGAETPELTLTPVVRTQAQPETTALGPLDNDWQAGSAVSHENIGDPQIPGAVAFADVGTATPLQNKSSVGRQPVIYDNGPYINSPGTGAGGADESVLQSTSLAMSTLGFGHQVSAGNRVADDFTIPTGETWTIGDIDFFAYQTNSPTTSTMTEVNLRIWDGVPGGGGSIVWGDTTTNVMTATDWDNAYRVSETTLGTTARPVMRQTVTVNTILTEGTYWLDWSTGGTLASGPWAPPITITGQATTGDGLQSTDGGVTYAAAIDTGSTTQQGFPFVIYEGGGPSITLQNFVDTVTSCPSRLDYIVVAPGTDVYYCWEVTNNGFVTLTLHDIVDSELGTVATGVPFTLDPGATTGAGTSAIPAVATATNTTTWTAYNPGPTDVAVATDSSTVVVSGPAPVVCNGPTVGFDAGIPPDWTVANNASGNPVFWTDLSSSGEAANYATGNGDCASASSDLQGGGSGLYDTELWTPPIDLTGQVSANLNYWANYGNFAGVDFLELDISTDGGSTWTNLLSWNEDHHPNGLRSAPGEEVNVDLTPYVGQTVILRWHYFDPTGPVTSQDWYAQIDEVSLTCVIPVELQSFSVE